MKTTLATVAVFSLIHPGLILAQQAAAQTTLDTAGGKLEEVVVTAQFRSEDAQGAAIPVDVVSSDDLIRAGVRTTAQLTSMVPALQISDGGQGNQALYVRGVGTFTANSYTDPGVALNIDGVYIGRPTSMKNMFYDLERIEVLKGPQGTLYGRNATGGAINVIPARPQIGAWSGHVGTAFGNYSALSVDGALNAPLTSSSAARLAFTYDQHDGYLSDGTNDADSYALRGQYLIEPSEGLSFRLSADFAHEGGAGGGSTIKALLDGFTLEPVLDPIDRSIGVADPRAGALYDGQYIGLSGRFGQAITVKPFRDNDYWGVKGELGWDVGVGTLTMLAAHRESSLDSLDFGTGTNSYVNQEDDQTSLEVRLAGPNEGLLRWLVGGYYYDENISTTYQFNYHALTAIQQFDTGTTSTAGFSQLTVAPADDFRIVGGIRVTRDEKPFDGVSNIFLNVCTAQAAPPRCPSTPFFGFATSPEQVISQLNLIPIAPGLYISPLPGAQSSIFPRFTIPIHDETVGTETTWRAALEYDAGPDSLLYASFETGYHAGGFAFAEIKPTFDAETIDAWTVGSKNRFFDDRLQLNLELFLWKYENQQISHFTNDVSGALVFVTENAGSSTNQGAEVSIAWRPASATTLQLDAQYLDAEYDEFTYNLPTTSGPPISGCPMTPVSPTLVSVDCSGMPALRSPEWTFNLGLEQVFAIGDYNLTAALDTHYQSKNVVGFEMLPQISEEDSYTMSNVALTFGPARETWSITAFVNNIEDERVAGQSFLNSTYNFFVSNPSPPRTYGIRAEYRW